MAVSMGGQASGRICNGAKKHVGAEVCSKNVLEMLVPLHNSFVVFWAVNCYLAEKRGQHQKKKEK